MSVLKDIVGLLVFPILLVVIYIFAAVILVYEKFTGKEV